MSESALADDMRNTALEALKAAKDEPEEQEEKKEKEEEVEEVEEDLPEEEEPEEDEPEEEPEEEEIEAASEDEPPEESEELPEPEADLDPRLINPPDTWRAQAKTEWDKLPKSIKEEVRKREDDAMNGINGYKEKAEFGDRLDRTIQPYQPILKQRGLTPEQAVGESLQFIHAMTTETPERKGAILQRLAQMYGADLSVTQDENSLKLQQQLQPLYQELNQLRQNSQQQQTQQEQQLQEEVHSFATKTDETGKLAHPFFENVRVLMASLIESEQADGLEQAYQIAVKAHPDTSGLIASEQTAKEEAERQEQAKKRAAKAKKNKDINVSKKGAHEEQSKPIGNLRDTAAEELKKIREAS